jgi:hypothetical protein
MGVSLIAGFASTLLEYALPFLIWLACVIGAAIVIGAISRR